MARNDEGEFELVLGNRQLISVFLIVVILLGVFFSMGYIVGRNSSPTDAARNSAIAKSVEPSGDTPSPVPSAAPPQASAPVPETKSPPPERGFGDYPVTRNRADTKFACAYQVFGLLLAITPSISV